MSWTFAQVKAADAAAGANPNITTAAATLNAQTTTTIVDVPVGEVEGYLLVNGILPAMQAWAAAHPTDTTGVLAVIESMQALVSAPTLETVAMSNPATNAAVTKMVGALAAAGLMTSAQASALLEMATVTIPVWQPPITPGDIQTARAQP